ncbi:hypothetical protein BC829DRAFT_414514 [Chytridium lagenaria]|nr:hypothetical protein BC829DRAFT_414514 [Chytridium lagenaria]
MEFYRKILPSKTTLAKSKEDLFALQRLPPPLQKQQQTAPISTAILPPKTYSAWHDEEKQRIRLEKSSKGSTSTIVELLDDVFKKMWIVKTKGWMRGDMMEGGVMKGLHGIKTSSLYQDVDTLQITLIIMKNNKPSLFFPSSKIQSREPLTVF